MDQVLLTIENQFVKFVFFLLVNSLSFEEVAGSLIKTKVWTDIRIFLWYSCIHLFRSDYGLSALSLLSDVVRKAFSLRLFPVSNVQSSPLILLLETVILSCVMGKGNSFPVISYI